MKSWVTQMFFIGFLALFSAAGMYLLIGEPDRSVPCVQSELKENYVCLATVLEEWGGDVLWVDARDKISYENAHLEGALLVPENDAENQLAEPEHMEAIGMAGVNGKKLVVYCATDACGGSELVANVILKTGFHSEVYVLQGGWKAILADRDKLTLNQ